MVKDIMFYSISLYLLFFIGCLSSTEFQQWDIDWELRHSSDSSLVSDTISAKFALSTKDMNNGPWYDTTTSGEIKIRMGLYDDLLEDDFSLDAKIYHKETIVIDTTIKWKFLKFENHINSNVFYVFIR